MKRILLTAFILSQCVIAMEKQPTVMTYAEGEGNTLESKFNYYLLHDKLSEALLILDEILKNPNAEYTYWLYRADINYRLGNFVEMLNDLDSALDVYPPVKEIAKIYYHKAIAYGVLEQQESDRIRQYHYSGLYRAMMTIAANAGHRKARETVFTWGF